MIALQIQPCPKIHTKTQFTGKSRRRVHKRAELGSWEEACLHRSRGTSELTFKLMFNLYWGRREKNIFRSQNCNYVNILERAD